MAGAGGHEVPARRQSRATAWTQDAVGADCEESLGQHMLEAAANTRCGGQPPRSPRVARALLDAEGPVPVFELHQALVGPSNPTQGRGEGGENRCAGAGRLTMRHPALVPDLGVARARGDRQWSARPCNVPRKRVERAWTGTSPSAHSGERALWTRPVTRPHRAREHGHGDGRPSPGSRWWSTAYQAELSAEVGGVQGQRLQGGQPRFARARWRGTAGASGLRTAVLRAA